MARVDTCSTKMRDLISCTSCCLERGVWCSSIFSHCCCSSIIPVHTPPMDKSTAKQRDTIKTIINQSEQGLWQTITGWVAFSVINVIGTSHQLASSGIYFRNVFNGQIKEQLYGLNSILISLLMSESPTLNGKGNLKNPENHQSLHFTLKHNFRYNVNKLSFFHCASYKVSSQTNHTLVLQVTLDR